LGPLLWGKGQSEREIDQKTLKFHGFSGC
jgi:hypothetical protein